MNFKLNTITIWTSTNLRIKNAWEEACRRAVSMEYEPTCTSGLDGANSHSVESGHFYGRSMDFRSKDVPFELRQTLKNTAQELLGPDYLVILENDHYHIQRQKNTF